MNHILQHPNVGSFRGNPAAILAELDRWGKEHKALMTIGPERGRVVTDLIAEARPERMVELGCYVGYSAILFGDAVRAAGGREYLSFEYNAEYAAIAEQLVELAGLQGFVKIVVGPSSASLRALAAAENVPKIDILFIDHFAQFYLTDLKIAESGGLLQQGSYLIADNTGFAGAKDYVDWVAGSANASKYTTVQMSEFQLASGETVSSQDPLRVFWACFL